MMKVGSITKDMLLSKEVVSFATLTAAAVLFPLLGDQMITGPLVNATLFLGVMLIGVRGAVLIAMFPSIIALSTGLLPAIMAPMVPFIIMGNVLLVLVFDQLKKSPVKGILFSSFAKFVFLFASSSLVIDLLIKEAAATQVATMMSWPQFITALIGGFLAYLLVRMRGLCYTELLKKSVRNQ